MRISGIEQNNMRPSPLRKIHPVPNRQYQEVEIGEKCVW